MCAGVRMLGSAGLEWTREGMMWWKRRCARIALRPPVWLRHAAEIAGHAYLPIGAYRAYRARVSLQHRCHRRGGCQVRT